MQDRRDFDLDSMTHRLESAQSLLPQSAHQPILAPFPKRTYTASKHVPFVHLSTESTNGCIIKKEGKSAVNRGLPKIFDT